MKKGFTLIELLAVIVILAIILAIAIPSIGSITDNAKRNAFADNAKMIIKAIDLKTSSDSTFDPTGVTASNLQSSLGIDATNVDTLTVTLVSGKVNVAMTGKGKWASLQANGDYNTVAVTDYAPAPTVTFTQASNKVTISVTSSIGVDNSSLKYIKVNACGVGTFPTPVDTDFTTSFTNNSQITITMGVWRFWVLAKDTNGNKAVILSDYFSYGACM